MNWDFALGLTKDVSLEPFYKGQEVQKLKLNEDLAKKAKEAERTQKMMEKFNVSNANIHPSVYSRYEQKIGDLAKEALTKSSRGELTPQEQFRYEQEIANAKTEFEGISKNLSHYQDQTPDKLDESGRYLQGELRAGKTLEEIRKNSPYENSSYMKLFGDNGEINYNNTYVTSNDPLRDIFKDVPQEHILESKVVDGRRIEAKGLARTDEDLRKLGLDLEHNISQERILKNEVSNKNFVNDLRRKYYKDYDLEAEKAAEYYAVDALKSYRDNPDYNSLLQSKIAEVKKDPMYSDLIEKKAAFEVGMKHAPQPRKYSERDLPKANVNVNNNYNGNNLTKPEGKQKYSGMLLAFGQQKDNTVSNIQNAATPQDAANAFFSATGISPSVDIAKNKGKNIKLYEPIPLSKEVKSKPYNMPIDAETLVERVVNGRKVQSKLSEVLDAKELEYLLNRNNVVSLYPKDQTMYAYDYNKNKFITADDVIDDKNVLANAAPYLRRYSDIDVQDLSKNLITDIGGVKVLEPAANTIIGKLRGIKFIQDKTQVEEASDWDKDEDDYTKSYQEEKNAPLQTQYKGTTNGNKTTTSTPKTIQKKKVAGF